MYPMDLCIYYLLLNFLILKSIVIHTSLVAQMVKNLPAIWETYV